ncbi:hypothetical protein K2173_014905 [Erythroxylum novogranatense]|uniref:Uncharacterized protein n=1 Tax=Erythroxylum novogranatense TaxID=1862640 RepID=A0AAV8TIK8_9ROSI|nr:hypothetical protein K2173_014905 [Erythroxylum novogranatense]
MAECLRIRSGPLILLLLIIIIIFLQVLPVVGEGGQHRVVNMQEKQPLAKMVIDTISMFKKSHKSSWEKFKTIIRDVQFKYFTPNLEGSEVNSGGGNSESAGTAGRMKEAAEKSFERSKKTAQESAKTAAEAVEGAVHKTADKVKEKLSEDDHGGVSRHDEL